MLKIFSVSLCTAGYSAAPFGNELTATQSRVCVEIVLHNLAFFFQSGKFSHGWKGRLLSWSCFFFLHHMCCVFCVVCCVSCILCIVCVVYCVFCVLCVVFFCLSSANWVVCLMVLSFSSGFVI